MPRSPSIDESGRKREADRAEGPQRVESPGAAVPLPLAQAFKQAAAARGILRTDLKVYRDGERLVLPLSELPPAALVQGDVRPVTARFEPAHRPIRSFRDVLDVPPGLEPHLPASWDVVGDVAIVKLSDEVLPHRRAIGEAMLAASRPLRVVALDRGVKGTFRIRELEIVAGRGPLHTVHRENGMDLEVDLASAYFSPRLAGERLRVAREVRPGERVLDMFAGVGPFAALVARTQRECRVDAVEINPDAYEYLEKNLQRARVGQRATPHLGDARDVVPGLVAAGGPYARVLMNLPHEVERFLPLAASATTAGSIVHVYEIVLKQQVAARGAEVARLLGSTAGAWSVRSHKVLRNYSPLEVGVVFDLERTG